MTASDPRPAVDPALVDFAVQIAREAGTLTLRYFRRTDLDVESKGDGTPVTVADREAERLLRDRIAEAFPDDSVVGEEEPDVAGTSDRTWVLDPIDGTQSFIHGVPLYANLVALEDNYGPAVGVINVPGLDECVWAGRGRGCFVDGELARVGDRTDLRGACAALDALVGSGAVIRTWGDAYGYVLVATGRADAMVDPVVSRWDVAPMLTILPEAGGLFCDLSGTVTAEGGDALAANPAGGPQVLALVGRT